MVPRVWLFILEYFWLFNLVGAYYRNTIGRYTFVSVSDAYVQLNQFDASNWCIGNGTQLMEIHDNDTQNAVVQFMKDFYNRSLVTGWVTITNAKRGGNGWQWVNKAATGGGVVIEKQGPDLSTSFGFLQFTGTRFLIGASLATEKRSYICEGGSYCSGGQTFNNRCYKSYTETMDWYDARNRCLDGGGELASFDFIGDSQGLSLLNGTWISSNYTYWIGISRVFWKWQSSDTEVKYTQWHDNQPTYDPILQCICLNPYEWTWIPCDCNEKNQFICLSVTNSPSTFGDSTTRSTLSTTTTTTSATSPSTTTKTTTTTTTAIRAPTKSFSSATNMFSTPKFLSPDGNNSKSESTVFTISESTPRRSWLGSHPTYNQSLGIGLGVGIAGGLIISAIIAWLYVRARKRGWSGTFPQYSITNNQSSSDNSYALIQRNSSQLSHCSSSDPPSSNIIIYAYPQIINEGQSGSGPIQQVKRNVMTTDLVTTNDTGGSFVTVQL